VVERVPLALASLRRFCWSKSSACPGPRGHHDASVILGEVPWLEEWWGAGELPSDAEKADPRWPTGCAACGRPFQPDDQWQKNFHQFFRAVDGRGSKFPLEAAPPGAMWYATWHPRKGPDGEALVVSLPDGAPWCVDLPGARGSGWTRTGKPPLVTASPSIQTPGYHGHLRGGFLEPC
jgi:hypothetical protein